MIPAAIASRSATGSSTLPSSVTWPVRRAIVPSTQSVATTTANRISRLWSCPGRRSGRRRRGSCAIRNAEMTLGTVSTRRLEPACGRPLARVHPSGRPDSNRRPSDPQSDALTKLRHGPSRPRKEGRPAQDSQPLRPRGAVNDARASELGTEGGSGPRRDAAPGAVGSRGTAGRSGSAAVRRRRSRTTAVRSRLASRSARFPCACGVGCSRCAVWTISFTCEVVAREHPPRVEVEQQRTECRCTPCPLVAEVRRTVAFAYSSTSSGSRLNQPVLVLDEIPLVRGEQQRRGLRPSRGSRSSCPRPRDLPGPRGPARPRAPPRWHRGRGARCSTRRRAPSSPAACPAVSTNRTVPCSGQVTSESTLSRVVPATSETTLRSDPTSRLNRLDLPTLGRPTIANRGSGACSVGIRRVGQQLEEAVHQIADPLPVQGRDRERARRARAGATRSTSASSAGRVRLVRDDQHRRRRSCGGVVPSPVLLA